MRGTRMDESADTDLGVCVEVRGATRNPPPSSTFRAYFHPDDIREDEP